MRYYDYKWFEHFFIIPCRWLRIHLRNWREMRQRCKVCGNADKFNYHVPDELWQIIVPAKYQNRVICLACFDEFAEKKKVDYTTSIGVIYFAGNDNSIKLRINDD